jgi:IS5 family transposase
MTPKQMSLSMQQDAGFERQRKPTRRDVFLAEMDQVVPWAELCAVIAPHYPKAPEPGAGGRRPVGLERMLRIHFLQQWYALSDPAIEDRELRAITEQLEHAKAGRDPNLSERVFKLRDNLE